jgi:hypothetical protein
MTTILRWRSAGARAWVPAVGGVAAVALAIAGCGGSSGSQHASGYGAPGPTKAAASAPVPGATAAGNSGAATISLASSTLGRILVNSKGDTLYLFQADKGTASTCNGACASVWPPVTTSSKPIAGAGCPPRSSEPPSAPTEQPRSRTTGIRCTRLPVTAVPVRPRAKGTRGSVPSGMCCQPPETRSTWVGEVRSAVCGWQRCSSQRVAEGPDIGPLGMAVSATPI